MKTAKTNAALKILMVFYILQVAIVNEMLSQTQYYINSDSKVVVEGTSTLHDWKSETTAIEGKARMDLKNDRITGLREVEVRIPVESIQSGKNLMDKKTYAALEAEDHPYITFNQSDVKTITTGKERNYTGTILLDLYDFNIDPPTKMLGFVRVENLIEVHFYIKVSILDSYPTGSGKVE